LRKIFSIFGPTGIGKSSLSIKLAKKINGEIIGVDSRQIYDGISIGTAQPSKKQLDEIPHHLIGFKKLNEKISSGEYLQLIDSKIEIFFPEESLQYSAVEQGYILNLLLKVFLKEVIPILK